MTRESTCTECGRHITSIGNQLLQELHRNLCAACWSIPGWFHDPEIRRQIAPNMKPKNPLNPPPDIPRPRQ